MTSSMHSLALDIKSEAAKWPEFTNYAALTPTMKFRCSGKLHLNPMARPEPNSLNYYTGYTDYCAERIDRTQRIRSFAGPKLARSNSFRVMVELF